MRSNACEPSAIYLTDMVPSTKAIDQAIAESVAFFNSRLEHERNLLLGMLGHDMWGPLHVIQATTHSLAKLDAGTDVAACAGRLLKSARSLKVLLDDLLDFNRKNSA